MRLGPFMKTTYHAFGFREHDVGDGMSKEDGKAMEEIMKGYHDLVEHGSREIYKIEG